MKHPAITKAAQGQECTLRLAMPCSHPDTVVACHIQPKGWGIMGGKVPDIFVAFGCHACHDIADFKVKTDLSRETILERRLAGMVETQLLLMQMGILEVKG